MSHQIEPLPYPSDALEPFFDRQTMEIHHGKHYATYVNNLNKALEPHPDLADIALPELLANECGLAPEAIRAVVRNNGGGAYNHALFWKLLRPSGGGEPAGTILGELTATFGSFDAFREKFATAATGRFGSGWAWLVVKDGKLEIQSTPNQDTPLMNGGFPLLGLDVWEHAYYLKYQNRRADYIAAFWNLVNWEVVEQRFQGGRER